MSDSVDYREIKLPGGTFRMYDDRPNVWVQQLLPGEKTVIEKINIAYERGEFKGKKK